MSRFIYKGRKTNEISFPLGGLGTGCIGLAGNGRLIDWEIFNKPNKNSVNGFSHFAIKAEMDGETLDARVLNGDLHPPYSGAQHGMGGFGFGPGREYMTGMPHFNKVTFRGEFPFASLNFKGSKFPGKVRMNAFNPFIPLNDRDSGIPAAFFEIEVKNTTDKTLKYSVAGTLTNPFPANNLNDIIQTDKLTFLRLSSDAHEPDEVGYGDLNIATDANDVSWQQYWFRGGWFDNLEVYWNDFMAPGKLQNREYPLDQSGSGNSGMLAAHIEVRPGKTGKIRYIISWNIPNCENYWNKNRASEMAEEAGISPIWKNYYATLWEDSKASSKYALTNWDRLYRETQKFKKTLFASDLPEVAIEAISANLSTLKTATVLRLEDGTFYGWEGCTGSGGCCEGSCTHVWNYAQALPFLFPKLERSMRKANYKYNQQPNGGMPFRIRLPLGIKHPGGRSCADGLFGDVIKSYRDWKICGDTEWLKTIWPNVKKSIEFAWDETNEDKWDPDKTGVLQGRQHHTLDMELFGPNAWLTGFYLGALKAASEMAEYLGESDTAEEYLAIFEKGKVWADRHLFNGEYYHQIINLEDKSIPERFNALDSYWNDEHQEIKYQIGEGCEIDQVLAQWHANLYGLGEIFDPKQVKTALKFLYKYSFKKSMRDFYNPCRIYTLNDESGLVIADWPEDKQKPRIPLPYSQETQNGYEWAACIQMIQAGLMKEGMDCVKAIRDRYDGEKRNPWNEIECGNNYARSMATYALLNTFSGFQFDMANGVIGFNPIKLKDGKFRCLWSLDSGWGEFKMKPGKIQIRLYSGNLVLKALELPFSAKKIVLAGKKVNFSQRDSRICFDGSINIEPNQRLEIFTS